MCTGCWSVSTDKRLLAQASSPGGLWGLKGGWGEIKRKGRETDIMLMCRRESSFRDFANLRLRHLEVLSPCSFFFFFNIYLWCRVLVAIHGLLTVNSVVAACRLSCPVACGILVPWPGIKPVSAALESRFLTTDHHRSPFSIFYWPKWITSQPSSKSGEMNFLGNRSGHAPWQKDVHTEK